MAVAARRASSESETRLEVHHVVLTFHPPLQYYKYQLWSSSSTVLLQIRSFERGFVIRRKIAIRRLRVVKVSLKRCQFCLDTFGRSSLKLPTEERRKKGKNVEKFCEKWVSSSSKNARIGSPVLVLSHVRIIGDNSWNFYRKSRTVQLPV